MLNACWTCIATSMLFSMMMCTPNHHVPFTISSPNSQGTGAVTLAGIISAVGVTNSTLADQSYVIYGAGSAGLGIAHQLRDGIVQIDKVPADKANKQFYLIDRYGLIKQSLGTRIRPALRDFVRPDEEWEGVPTNEKGEVSLLEVIKKIKPTVLIGCSTHAGAFTEEIVREMAKGVDRPIIFPLSNPSRLVEVDPAKANDWTNGKALLATGSPFPAAKMPNGKDYM
jgi:malate dehydrogenase (oxaloacetate-decarboxylating)